MAEIMDQIRRIGWLVAEAGLLIVILCVLLNIILGPEASGAFVSEIAANANSFLQGLPAGVLVGLALVVLAYGLVRPRLES
jgi:hypothetical protein